MSINVRAKLHPFRDDHTDFQCETAPLAELYARLNSPLDIAHARFLIDDEMVLDPGRTPPDGSTVFINVVAEGGGNPQDIGKGSLWVGLGIAALGTLIAVFSGGVLSSIGIAIIGSGVSMALGGAVLMNTEIPSASARETGSQMESVRGSKNQTRKLGYVPVLFGRHLVAPDAAAPPYTEIDSNGEQWLVQLFCAGYNDLLIEAGSFKVGDTALVKLSETNDINAILAGDDKKVKLQILQGGASSTLYPHICVEQQFNRILKDLDDDGLDASLTYTTPDKTTCINVDIIFPQGLVKYDDEDKKTARVSVFLDYRKEGDPYYTSFPDWDPIVSDATVDMFRPQATVSGLAPGKYTVHVTRSTSSSSDSNTIDTVFVGSIRAFADDRPVREEAARSLAIIALKIKASALASGVIDNFNFVAQSYIPDYTPATGAWTRRLTKNPASMLLYALQGKINPAPVADDDIDWDSLREFWTFCNDKNYACNAVQGDRELFSVLCAKIAKTGRASILRVNGKFAVVIDRERPAPTQLFSPRNTISYRQTIVKADIPDEIALEFIDETTGWASNERSVYNTPDGLPTGAEKTKQSSSVWGITDPDTAFKFARYQLACATNRPVVHALECDIEYLLAKKGDLIEYAGDTALAGIAYGKVTAVIRSGGAAVGIAADTLFPQEAGKTYGVRCRRSNGQLVELKVVNQETGAKDLRFETPQAPNILEEGDLVVFGIAGQIVRRLIVTEIAPADNFRATLTCVDYSPEIFGVDDPAYVAPPFDNKITTEGSVTDSGIVNAAEWQTWFTYHDSLEMPEKPVGGGTTGGWHRYQTPQSRWVSAKTARSIADGDWSIPAQTSFLVDETLRGLITVNPGPPGSPATVYQLIPGATVIKRYASGVVDPPAISCAQQSITGNDPPAPSNKTLKYVTEQNGEETLCEGPVTVGDWDFIEFRLYDDNGVLLDRENVPVLSDGPPATVYHLLPSVPLIVRNPSGEASPPTISCSQQVVIGNKPPEASDKTLVYITSANQEETEYANAPIPVAWDWIEFRLRDGAALLDQERVFVLSEGEPARTYELQPSASVIRLYDGITDPYKIACAQVSITGAGLPAPADKTLRYATSLDDEQDYEGELTVNPAWGWIEFRLYDGDVLLDKERVPVLADGASLVYLDLANQHITVRADEYGNPYGLPLTTQATLYNGNTPITNAAFAAKVAEKNIVYYPGDIFDPLLGDFYPIRSTQWSISQGSIDQNGIITISELPEDQAEIVVSAFYDDVDYTATLTLLKVRDGESPAVIDIENENASIACDAYGAPFPGELPFVTKAFFYKGTEPAVPFWYLNTPIRGVSIAQDGTIAVAEDAGLGRSNSIPVVAAYRGKTYVRTLTITKALEGFTATVYELLPSARVARRDAEGNNTPATISCAQQKIVGNSDPEPSDKTLAYITSASSKETPYTGPITVGSLGWIEFRLYSGNTLLDQERVPVVSNGADGVDSIALDLENENTTVRCDAYGVPYPDSLPLATKAILYDGWDEAAPAWSLESPPAGVSISSDGTITVAQNAALGNTNNIRVKALYKGVSYFHVFTIGKTLDGESPITLDLLPDNEVIQCDHLGNPLQGLPLTAQATLRKGTQEISAAMELAEVEKVDLVYYPGDTFDPMLGDFYPALSYPIVWTLAGAPKGVTVDQRGLITVSAAAQLNDVNRVTVRAAYHGNTYEAIFGIAKARGGAPGTAGKNGDPAKTPQYRGATNIADTGNTGKARLTSGVEIAMNDLDWVLFMGTADWTKARLYQWRAGEKVWVMLEPAQSMSRYMDVLETITENAADGIFSAVFCRVLFAQTAAIEKLQSQVIKLNGENGITLDGTAGTIQSANYKYAEPSGMNTERSGFKLQNGYLSFVGDRINSWFIRSLKGYMPTTAYGDVDFSGTSYMRGGIRGMAQFWHENGVLTTGVRSYEYYSGLGFSGQVSRIATGVYKITYVCEDSEEVKALAQARIFGYYARTTKSITGSDGKSYTIPAAWGTIISTGHDIVIDNTNLTITYVFVCKDNNSDNLEEDPAYAGYIYLIG